MKRYTMTRHITTWALLVLLAGMLLTNASCTMFLIKEGYKEIKKIEEEKKEKKEQQQQQWQNEQLPDPYTAPRDESDRRKHHGQWTPQREER